MPNPSEPALAPLLRLRQAMKAAGLDGLVVPRFDAYQGEVVAPHDERLKYLTGFTGSAGIALVTLERAVLFVDGRYQIQARAEIDTASFEIAHFHNAPIERWLETNALPGSRIGINTMLVPHTLFGKIADGLAKAQGELVPLESDLVDHIWAGQPAPPLGAITAFPVARSGETSLDKRGRIARTLDRLGADLLIETQPDNIAWLLNVRGSDIPNVPVAHSAVIIDSSGAVDWFVDTRKLPNDLGDFELDGVTLQRADGLLGALAERAGGRSALVDPDFAPAAVRLAVEVAGGVVLSQMSPITTTKAVKNPVELDGFRNAHVEDGIAVTEFMAWLHAEVPKRLRAGNPLTELDAQAMLQSIRAKGDGYAGDSFTAISASGSNAAMCHYSSKPSTNAPITDALPYLIDSGGQYGGGTTDITRTLMFGAPGADVVQTYTAVLKGFIALMTAQFPPGTCGHHLDALARRPLWDLGLDYDHGTGHGVGHMLSVHEHPHRFGKPVNPHPFEPGVVMTIEPGYYREGAFGLRVENQVVVTTGAPGFLRFETLTLAPIALGMADMAALTRAEIGFINTYHAQVHAALAGRLSPQAEAFLTQATEPV